MGLLPARQIVALNKSDTWSLGGCFAAISSQMCAPPSQTASYVYETPYFQFDSQVSEYEFEHYYRNAIMFCVNFTFANFVSADEIAKTTIIEVVEVAPSRRD